MAFWSGNGGGMTVGGGSELNIGKWELNSNARLVENTHSGTSGSTNYDLVVYDNSSTVDIPWDDTNLPDTDMGLVRGTKVTIVFQMGGSGKTATLTNTTVETHTTINDPQNDIVRSRITTKGGVYTAPTT
jgi:hypothetical protein